MTRAEQIAAVLADHRRMGYSCSCAGWNGDLTAKDMRPLWDQQLAHVAAALDAALAAQGERCGAGGAAALEALADDYAERSASLWKSSEKASAQGRDATALIAHAVSYDGASKRIRAALADPAGVLAKVKADAWDEGWLIGYSNCTGMSDQPRTANPYRQEAGR